MPSLFENAARLVRREAPWFVKRLASAQEQQTPLVMHLSEVEDNPLLLYACVWMAARKGVTIQIDPTPHNSHEITSN